MGKRKKVRFAQFSLTACAKAVRPQRNLQDDCLN